MTGPNLIVVMGPTASGKSVVAETLAEQQDATIINADAFQIYRGMDIGTAKPISRSRYRILDIRNPDEDFGVGEYVVLASTILHELFQTGQSVILCGGTGLYIRALVEQYKDLMPSPSPELRRTLASMTLDEALGKLTHLAPDIASQIDQKNEVRVRRSLEKQLGNRDPIQFTLPPFEINKIAIMPSVELSQEKIKQRTDEMFQNGWVVEVRNLLDGGYGPGSPGFRALGYKAIAEYIRENGNEEVLKERIEAETVRYAKRQRTWLRAEPNLVVYSEVSEALDAIGHR
jgi:tRNA dimethylallyltransferase